LNFFVSLAAVRQALIPHQRLFLSSIAESLRVVAVWRIGSKDLTPV
jgi:hypothetical protein